MSSVVCNLGCLQSFIIARSITNPLSGILITVKEIAAGDGELSRSYADSPFIARQPLIVAPLVVAQYF